MKRPIAIFVLGAVVVVSLYMLGLVALGQRTMSEMLAHVAENNAEDLVARGGRAETVLHHQGNSFATWVQQVPQFGDSISLDVISDADGLVFRLLFSQLRAVAISDSVSPPRFIYHENQEPAHELEEAIQVMLAQIPPAQEWSQVYWPIRPFQTAGDSWVGYVVPRVDAQTNTQTLITAVLPLETVLETLDMAIAGSISSLWIIDDAGLILHEPVIEVRDEETDGIRHALGQAGFVDLLAETSANWGSLDGMPGWFAWSRVSIGDWDVYALEPVGGTAREIVSLSLWGGMIVLGVIIAVALIAIGIRMYFYTQRILTSELEMRTRQLVQVRNRYSTLFEHSPDPIFVVDPFCDDGVWRLDECNKKAANLLGYEPAELVGMDVNELFVNPIDWVDRGWFLDEHQTQQTVAFESVLRRKDGSTMPLELSSVMLNDQGRRLLLVIGRDVRSRQQVQTLEDDYDQMVLALNQVAIDITSTLTVDTILFRLVEAAHQLFPQSFAATVQLLSESGDEMVTAFASEGAIETPQKVVFKPGVGIAGLAIAGKTVVNVADINHDPRFVPGKYPPPFKSLLVAPMATSSRVWGTLSIEGIEPGVFSKRDERMANMLARQAGVALENAYLYRTAQQDREIADALREIGMVLTGALRQEDVLRQVIEQVEHVLHYSAASIYLAEPDGSYYRFVGVGYAKYHLPDSDGRLVWTADQDPVMRQVGTRGEVIIVSDTVSDPTWLSDSDYEWVGSWAGAPIQVRGELIGVFCLDHEQTGFYGEQHRRILEAFAAQVSIAIENALLFEQVQNHARHLQDQVAERTEEIRVQQARTDAILRSIDDAVITFEPTGAIMYANEACCRLVDYDMATLIGSNVSSYFHRDTPRAILDSMLSSIQSNELWRGEINVMHRDGYPILIDVVAVPYLQQDGTPIGYIASMRHLSDEQVTERMKAQFMTLVSHELRTPLTNLKLHLHLLRKTADDPDTSKRYLDALEAQTSRLTEMMEKVLTVTRLTDRDAISNNEPLNLESLLDSLLVRFRSLAAEKNITLDVEPEHVPTVDGVIRGDGQWVAQACFELLENALVYTPEEGAITIRIQEFQKGQRFLGIAVHDTGPGIAPQELELLQAAFIRVGDQRSGETPGIGLGLSIASTVADQLGGGLLVDSEPGQGSVFTFYLPIRSFNEQL